MSQSIRHPDSLKKTRTSQAFLDGRCRIRGVCMSSVVKPNPLAGLCDCCNWQELRCIWVEEGHTEKMRVAWKIHVAEKDKRQWKGSGEGDPPRDNAT